MNFKSKKKSFHQSHISQLFKLLKIKKFVFLLLAVLKNYRKLKDIIVYIYYFIAYLCFSNLIVAVKAMDNKEFITDIITPLYIKFF
jgi:hypothetical protein